MRSVADTVGKRVSRKVQESLSAGSRMSPAAEKVASVTEIHRELAGYNEARVRGGLTPLSDHTHQAVLDAVMAHVYGLGELDALWGNADVENIDVNGPNKVFVTFVGGERVRWTPVAADQDELIDLIRRAARQLGANEVDFDARHPQLDLQLPDGSRLFAVFGGDAGNGVATEPLLSIRRHRYLAVSMDDLVELGVLPAAAGEFIVAAFRAGENLIVAGDHNAGKTTFLRAVCFDAIDVHQRVVTVEAYITELGLHQGDRLPNTVDLRKQLLAVELNDDQRARFVAPSSGYSVAGPRRREDPRCQTPIRSNPSRWRPGRSIRPDPEPVPPTPIIPDPTVPDPSQPEPPAEEFDQRPH